jgi:hypothetical protein
MPKIKAHDEIKIKSSVDEVWIVLTDIPNYYKWWPKSVNLKILNFRKEVIGTEFKANPLGGKSFSCKVVGIVPMKEIRLEYFNGIYRGKGVWNIEIEDQQVKVGYTVDLEISDKSIVLLAKILPVSKLHSMIFKRILSGLEKELEARNRIKQILHLSIL